jgi:hypothetical protein
MKDPLKQHVLQAWRTLRSKNLMSCGSYSKRSIHCEQLSHESAHAFWLWHQLHVK